MKIHRQINLLQSYISTPICKLRRTCLVGVSWYCQHIELRQIGLDWCKRCGRQVATNEDRCSWDKPDSQGSESLRRRR